MPRFFNRLNAFSLVFVGLIAVLAASAEAQTPAAETQNVQSQQEKIADWNQWRGPKRDGKIDGVKWPNELNESTLKQKWSVPMGPSYSGPIVVGDRVFTTMTENRKSEVVIALDRETGKEVWRQGWDGAMSVPFFARANGDWIRATPVYDDGRLYVAGMKDVLVCLDASDGKVIWKVDFPAQTKSTVPSFGMVCSPLIDGEHLYVQAGGGFCKLDKSTGKIIWTGLKDGGGMNGSAFSSPIIETVAGKRQAIIQTRTALAGVDLDTGKKLWSQDIKTFRGMNIITPTKYEDSFFVSAYGGTTQLISVTKSNVFSTTTTWNQKGEGYMSTPIVIGDHGYLHLRNQRFACFNLENGNPAWRSETFGKYASMVASGDKILALDQRGMLLLIKADPASFQKLGSLKVGSDSWAHLAVRGKQVFVRNLDSMIMLEFQD